MACWHDNPLPECNLFGLVSLLAEGSESTVANAVIDSAAFVDSQVQAIDTKVALSGLHVLVNESRFSTLRLQPIDLRGHLAR